MDDNLSPHIFRRPYHGRHQVDQRQTPRDTRYMTDDQQQEALRPDPILSYYKEMSENYAKNLVEFAKMGVAISGAGLTASMAFLKDIIGEDGPRHLWALIGSWLVFTSTMVSVLMYYVFAAKYSETAADQISRRAWKTERYGGKWRNRALNCLKAVLVFTISGILLLGTFVLANIIVP